MEEKEELLPPEFVNQFQVNIYIWAKELLQDERIAKMASMSNDELRESIREGLTPQAIMESMNHK